MFYDKGLIHILRRPLCIPLNLKDKELENVLRIRKISYLYSFNNKYEFLTLVENKFIELFVGYTGQKVDAI